MYKRLLRQKIQKKFFKGKIIVIAGARQTGKTTLSLEIIKKHFNKKDALLFNCDNPTDRLSLANKDLEFLKQLVGKAKIILIDEAQKVENVGETLKLLADFYKTKKQILVTGSSSINLLDDTQEPLTGRKFVYNLFPLSLEEIFTRKNYLTLIKELEALLIFGSYPEVVLQKTFQDKQQILQELTSSYIYKDILEFQKIKSSDLLLKLLKALALQIGSQVSYNELAGLIGIDKKTIEKYINLLEKSFVIFRLPPYSKNKRREIAKLNKVYFYDLGIRNTIINNFNFLENRNDIGALWENFMIVERMKYRAYHNIYASQYFWRTYDGSEVDLVEERSGQLHGFEFKWSKDKTRIKTPPTTWLKYTNSTYSVITIKNLKGFII